MVKIYFMRFFANVKNSRKKSPFLSEIFAGYLPYDASGTTFYAGMRFTLGIVLCERFMFVIDGSAIFAKNERNGIMISCVICLAGKQHSFVCDIHLMNEVLCFEGIDNAIEGCEIHVFRSFADEEFFEFGKSRLWVLADCVYKKSSLTSDSRF